MTAPIDQGTGQSIPSLVLPATPAALLAHFVESHGWAGQTSYHPSMMAAHRIAHGADIAPELRTPVGHDHPFSQAFKGFMGGGRPDLADPALRHTHGTAAPVQSVTGWRAGNLPAFATGLVLMAVGLFMPWLSVVAGYFLVDVDGLDTDHGKIIGVGILILAAVAYGEARSSHLPGRIVLLVGPIILYAVVGYAYFEMTDRLVAGPIEINDNPYRSVKVGYGLYLTGAGALTATLAAGLRLFRKRA